MYKLVIRYFGELCDKEQVGDEEVFDEVVVMDSSGFPPVQDTMKEIIKEQLKDGFVLDEQYNGSHKTAIMFLGEQENWNAYIEIKIVGGDLKRQAKDIANDYEKMSKEDFEKKLLALEDSLEIHYQEIKNAVFKNVVEKRLKMFNGRKTLNNQEFIDYVRDLEKEFECEIDLIDFTIIPNYC